MAHTSQAQLALYGGTPVRTRPLPTVNDASGHSVEAADLARAIEALQSGRWNRTTGDQVTQLEAEFAGLFGVRHCTASSSGTAALHIAVGALERRQQGVSVLGTRQRRRVGDRPGLRPGQAGCNLPDDQLRSD